MVVPDSNNSGWAAHRMTSSATLDHGCSIVSCSSLSSRSNSGHAVCAAAPSEQSAATQPPQSAAIVIRVPGDRKSSAVAASTPDCYNHPSLSLDTDTCFTPTLDTDASERLLPRPARAAARAAAVAAGGGGVIVQRRFLTLHRRKKRKPAAPMAPHRALLDDLYPGPTQNVLERVGEWDFNAFALDSVSGGRPVSVLCVYLLHKYNLINTFKMDTVTVWKCFSLIEEGYHTTNPYHNAVHAADVTQAMHCYLQEKEISRHMTPLESLAALVAAVCHDLDHPGVNQPFLIATDNHLAALYKNLSVLENHHWRCAMGCLWESGLLEGWHPEDVAKLQDQIRSLILATDITRQQEFLTKFKKYQETGSMNMEEAECRHFSLQIALKCADICNPCRPFEISKKWSQKICDEFYRQGDYERQLNIPVTALCDRYVTSVAKIQTGFIEYVVFPLFGAWHQWLKTPLSSAMMQNLKTNLVRWQEIMEEDGKGIHKALQPFDESRKPIKVPEEAEKDSSSDSSISELPKISSQNVVNTTQTVVGRRHSLPLNVPTMLPRTVIRRESLSKDGQHPIVLETIHMEGMTLSTVSQTETDMAGSTTQSGHISVNTNMDTSSASRHQPQNCQSKSGRRRMSLPGLLSHHSHHRIKQQVSTLQPLPATPSLEELRLPGILAESAGQSSQDGNGSSQPSQSTQTSAATDAECGVSNNPSCDSEERINDSRSYSGQTFSDSHSAARKNDKSENRDHNITGGSSLSHNLPSSSLNANKHLFKNNNNYSNSENNSESIVHQNKRQCSELTRSSRRASLDSSMCVNINLNENLNLHHSNLNLDSYNTNKPHTNLNANHTSVEPASNINKWMKRNDKENREPCKSRGSLLARTRYWRSLTHDDDSDTSFKPSNNANCSRLVHQQVLHHRGRRGSAPILRGSAPLLQGELPRSALARPSIEATNDLTSSDLSRRRASAPTHHLLQGILDVAGRVAIQKHLVELTNTTSGHPSDLPVSVAERLGLDNATQRDTTSSSTNSRYVASGSSAGCGGGSAGRYSNFRDHTTTGGYARDLKDYVAGGGYGSSRDFRRGSSGMELFTDMWRYKQECGYSQNSSDDMEEWSASPGGLTPTTPSGYPPLHSLHHQHPFRRGSLPCDFAFSGELRLFQLETS